MGAASRTASWCATPHLAAEADHERAAAMGLDFAQHRSRHQGAACRGAIASPSGGIHAWLQPGTSRVHMKRGLLHLPRVHARARPPRLAACKPLLAAQWHPTQNGARTPHEVDPRFACASRAWLCSRLRLRVACPRSPRGRWTATDARAAPGRRPCRATRTPWRSRSPTSTPSSTSSGCALSGVDPLRVHVRSNREFPWICDERLRATAGPGRRRHA